MFFDDFDNLFSGMFNRFRRPVLDQKYYSVYKKDKGYVIVFNTLGMDKDDIKISVEKQKGSPYRILRVKGQKNIEDIDFQNSVDMALSLNFNDEIESTSYTVKDGLTKVYLKVKMPEPKKDDSDIKYIDDSGSLDW